MSTRPRWRPVRRALPRRPPSALLQCSGRFARRARGWPQRSPPRVCLRQLAALSGTPRKSRASEPASCRASQDQQRAARNIARQRPEIQWLHGERLGRVLVFFRHDEVMSYAMARLKADRFHRYRSKDPRLHGSDKEGALRRELSEGSHRELIRPGGAWRRQVEIFLTRQRRTSGCE
jgi:hypothetical protein